MDSSLRDWELVRQTGPPIKKYLKAFIKYIEEHRILEVFIDLDKDTSALLLSIAETTTELSARIYNELTAPSSCTRGIHASENVDIHLLICLAAQIEMPHQQKKASVTAKAAMENLPSSSANQSSVAIISDSEDKGVERRHPITNKEQQDAKGDTTPAGQ